MRSATRILVFMQPEKYYRWTAQSRGLQRGNFALSDYALFLRLREVRLRAQERAHVGGG